MHIRLQFRIAKEAVEDVPEVALRNARAKVLNFGCDAVFVFKDSDTDF